MAKMKLLEGFHREKKGRKGGRRKGHRKHGRR
jgi:hypothetical protein